MTNKITKVYRNGVAYDIYASGGAAGTGDVTGPASSTDADIALFSGSTGKLIKDSGKKLSDYQTALSTQTAYTTKGSATKVPQISTNTLGQVTSITEVTITQPTVNDTTITFTQGGVSKGDITLNQSSAETIALDAGFTPGGTATTGYVVTKTADGYEWAAPSGGDVMVSSQSGNILTSGMKIWAGTQANYDSIGSGNYDSNTLYLTI